MRKLFFVMIVIGFIVGCQKEDLSSMELQSSSDNALVSAKSTAKLGQNTLTIQVAGVIEEQIFQATVNAHVFTFTGKNNWSGDLVGSGHVKIFSGDPVDPYSTVNIVSRRFLFTSQGNLFMDEVGAVQGSDIHTISTITGGTGIYKKAQGQLVLEGILGNGPIIFLYREYHSA